MFVKIIQSQLSPSSRLLRRPRSDLHFNLLQRVLAASPRLPGHSVVTFGFDAASPIVLPVQIRLVALEVPPGAGESTRTVPVELLLDAVVIDVHRGELIAVVFGQRVPGRTVHVAGHEDPKAVRLVRDSESVVVDDVRVAVPVRQFDAKAVVILVRQ